MGRPQWKRVVLKLSGEAFAGSGDENIDHEVVEAFAEQLAEVKTRLKLELAVVVGGGNIMRGKSAASKGFNRAMADYMGMEATNMNAIALREELKQRGVPARGMTALHTPQALEPYILPKLVSHLEKGYIVILAGGLGIPFFTTDSTAAVRAAEISADVVLKGMHSGLEGIYTADPRQDQNATFIPELGFKEAIDRELLAMDMTAFTICRENDLPIVVFDMMTPGNLRRVLEGERIGTYVS